VDPHCTRPSQSRTDLDLGPPSRSELRRRGGVHYSKAPANPRVDVAAAKEAHRELSNQLNRLNNDVRSAQETWAKLSGNEFGRDGEWKKLDGTCVDKVSGE
jgi:hypothetical protein